MDLSKMNQDINAALNRLEKDENFTPGTPVIYAMYGKCQLMGIETRTINGESIPFYKLELVKSSLSRSTKKDPAIWIPVAVAKERGLRAPLKAEQAIAVFQVLSSREYYFDISQNWNEVQPKLETAIRREGALGLAKVASYLYVLKRKTHHISAEALKLQEVVNKLLLRELSDAIGEHSRSIEEKIVKQFKHKLSPDN
jgi:RNA polymerase-interacting CarD/CdnL/TRCF family regulator